MKKRTIIYIVVILVMLVIAVGVFVAKKHTSHNKEDITLLADQVFYINNGSLINQGGTLI